MIRFLRSPFGLALVTAASLAGIGLLALGLVSMNIDNDVRNFMPTGHPDLEFCDRVEETFGSADAIVVALDGPKGLTPEVLELVRTITRRLEEEHEDVTSLANADTIVAEGATLKPKPLLEDGPVTDESIRLLQDRLDDWPLFVNMLISADRKVPVVALRMQTGLDVKAREAILEDIRQTVASAVEESGLDVTPYFAGEPVISLEVGKRVGADLRILAPLALLVVLVVLLLSLRTVGGVVGPILTVGLSVVATFGLMGLLGRPIMTVTSAIPVFLVAVGSAYGIHVAAHFRRHWLEGLTRREAMHKALGKVSGAVVGAAVTTIGGFLSLSTSKIVPIFDFGIFLAFGVTVAMVLSFSMIPLLLLLGRSRAPEAKVARRQGAEGDGRLAFAIEAMVLKAVKNRKSVIALTALATIGVAVAAALLITVDQNTVNFFPEDSPVRTADNFFTDRFAGIHTLSVVLTGEHERSLLAPAALNFMAGLQQEMEANPDVGKTVSLADFVRRMNQVMHEGKKEFDAIPGSQEMIAQYIQLYELSGDPDDFSSQVDFDYRMGQVLIQMRDGSAARTRVVKEMAQRYAAEHLPSGFDLRLAGSLVRYDTVNIYIVSGQLWSLASSLLMVFAVVALLFSRRMTLRTGAEAAGRAARWARGLSAGGLTLIPILTAVAMNFGAMVLLGIPLDIATALISSCAIGIGIDYSIHLLYRYELERSEGATVTAAISIAARACGPPILYNATAVSAGFLTLLYSDFLALHTLAWLTALAMFVTAFSALTLLPAWLFVRDGRAELAGRP